MNNLLTLLQNLPLSAAMRGEMPGTEWLFPIVETFHVITLTLVFGSIAMVDLRLLGVASPGTSVRRLALETLPWTWTAWVLSAISGSLMFMAKAHTYWGNTQFRLKFLCMALAFVNMLVFHFGVYRSVEKWDALHRPPNGVRVAGALSVLAWIGVIFFGRWIGFTS